MSSFRKGDRVIIQLNTKDIYQGVIEYYSNTMLEITNIIYDNIHLDDNLCFRQDEIDRIYQLTNKFPYLYHIFEDRDNFKYMKLPNDELQRINIMVNESIYITRIDKDYYRAIDEINCCECIGCIGLGHSIYRDKGFSLIVISTVERIFIFDMIELVNLHKLKDIFTTDTIKKVLHNGKIFYDCLLHKYNVKMMNIFDIQHADSLVWDRSGSNHIQRSLSQCLLQHLNLPVPFDDDSVDLFDSKWRNRPFTNKVLVSNLVAFLLPLHDYLNGILLKDVHREINTIYNR